MVGHDVGDIRCCSFRIRAKHELRAVPGLAAMRIVHARTEAVRPAAKAVLNERLAASVAGLTVGSVVGQTEASLGSVASGGNHSSRCPNSM